MSELLEAIRKIEELKIKYNLSAEEVFTLQILKSIEIDKVNYEDFLKYILSKKEKSNG